MEALASSRVQKPEDRALAFAHAFLGVDLPVRRIEVDTPIEKLAGSSPPMSFDANQAAPAVPAAEPWLTLPGLPRAVMDNSVVQVDGKVYSFGGAAGESLADVYVYDPTTQSWSRTADMPY